MAVAAAVGLAALIPMVVQEVKSKQTWDKSRSVDQDLLMQARKLNKLAKKTGNDHLVVPIKEGDFASPQARMKYENSMANNFEELHKNVVRMDPQLIRRAQALQRAGYDDIQGISRAVDDESLFTEEGAKRMSDRIHTAYDKHLNPLVSSKKPKQTGQKKKTKIVTDGGIPYEKQVN